MPEAAGTELEAQDSGMMALQLEASWSEGVPEPQISTQTGDHHLMSGHDSGCVSRPEEPRLKNSTFDAYMNKYGKTMSIYLNNRYKMALFALRKIC
jgi:hypothetical protein